MRLSDICHGTPRARDIQKGILAAAEEKAVLFLDPTTYDLDEPCAPSIDFHVGRSWGVVGVGAYLVAQYDEPAPPLTIDVHGQGVSVRFLTLDGFSIVTKNRQQHGLVLQCLDPAAFLYAFSLHRLSVENADDALRLEGSVFEADIEFPRLRDSTCGLAMGNAGDARLSQINVYGGTLAQNVDAVRTFSSVPYAEPFDFTMFGTYLGNNARYAVNAPGGVQLLKGVRMENAWCDPATYDPENKAVRAGVRLNNFGVLENCWCGGNGNATHVVDAWLAGNLVLRDSSIYNSRDPTLRLAMAHVDADPARPGQCAVIAERCLPNVVEAPAHVRVRLDP